MMRLERPVLPDDGIAKIADLPQHGLHQSGTQLGGVVLHTLLLVTTGDVLRGPPIVVESRAAVQEGAATLHVPVHVEGRRDGEMLTIAFNALSNQSHFNFCTGR